MVRTYDNLVQGNIYVNPELPNIKYFIDGEEYVIDKYSAIVIGGAYSVDKYYRLEKFKGQGWFKDEQLTSEEMNAIAEKIKGKHYDFVLTHTCPYEWQPTDLFISSSFDLKVDNTMELWFHDIKDTFSWTAWLFGHYHDDRIIRPHVELFYIEDKELKDIYKMWSEY